MKTRIQFGSAALLLVAFAYFANAMNTGPDNWHIIDGANLIFHEAGHVLFIWGPHWMEIAGGSFFQVLLPLGLVAYSSWKRQPLAAALLLMWTGQSLANVSVYADDALRQQLPLIADGAIHDWNHLLVYFGLLRHTAQIAKTMLVTGWMLLIAGTILGIWSSFRQNEDEETKLTPTS